MKVPADGVAEEGTALFLRTSERWGTEDWDNVVTLKDAAGDAELVLTHSVPTA